MTLFGGTGGEAWRIDVLNAEDASYDSIDIRHKLYDRWIVSFVEQGELEVEDGGLVHAVRTGQVMLHAPGLPFSETARGPGRHKWMLLECSGGYGVDLFRLYPVPEALTLSDPAAFSRLFDALIADWRSPAGPFRDMELQASGLRLLAALLKDWQRQGCPPRRAPLPGKDERLERVMRMIADGLGAKITRERLAEAVHLNANYLDSLFEAKYGMKPMRLLRELRLREAKRLLENGGAALAEIAERCGMADASYLSKTFVRRFGFTPGHCREQARLARTSYYRPEP